jgi:hypothetical protein
MLRGPLTLSESVTEGTGMPQPTGGGTGEWTRLLPSSTCMVLSLSVNLTEAHYCSADRARAAVANNRESVPAGSAVPRFGTSV